MGDCLPLGPGVTPSPRQTPPSSRHPSPLRPLQRTVRILLKCIYVPGFFQKIRWNPHINGKNSVKWLNSVRKWSFWKCHTGTVPVLRAHCSCVGSVHTERKRIWKRNFSLMFEFCFFDLLRSFFDLLCFCVGFCSVWTGLKSHSQFLISAKILGSICTWRQRCVFSVVRCEQIHWWQCNPSLTTWLQRQNRCRYRQVRTGP